MHPQSANSIYIIDWCFVVIVVILTPFCSNTTAFQPAAPKTSSGSNYVSCGGWFKAAQTKSVLAILRSKQITSVSVILEREEANAKCVSNPNRHFNLDDIPS
jgi:hypothetical protein